MRRRRGPAAHAYRLRVAQGEAAAPEPVGRDRALRLPRGRRGTETEAVANELPASERKRIERLLLRKYPVGFAVEIAFLRPLHGGLAALGRGRKRGRPLFFEILVTRALLVLSALHLPEAIAV